MRRRQECATTAPALRSWGDGDVFYKLSLLGGHSGTHGADSICKTRPHPTRDSAYLQLTSTVPLLPRELVHCALPLPSVVTVMVTLERPPLWVMVAPAAGHCPAQRLKP